MRSMVEGAWMRAPATTFDNARRLRREMTLPEVILWQKLRRGALGGLRFRRQHPIGSYVLDFFCAKARLAVEVDGTAHDSPDQARRDETRDASLASAGILVLRFPAIEVLDRDLLQGVLETISAAASERAGHSQHKSNDPYLASAE